MAMSPGRTKVSHILSAKAASNSTNGHSQREHFARSTAWRAAQQVRMTISPRNTLTTSQQPSWVDACLAEAMVHGETILGTVGGEKIHHSIHRCLLSRITPANLSR